MQGKMFGPMFDYDIACSVHSTYLLALEARQECWPCSLATLHAGNPSLARITIDGLLYR